MSLFNKIQLVCPFVLLLVISCTSTPERVSDTAEPENVPETIEETVDPIAFYKSADDAAEAIKIMAEMEEEKMDRESRFLYYSLLISNNDIEKAVEQLEILLDENKDDLEALSAYITLMDYTGDKKKRDESLNHLVALDERNSFALNMKGTIALRSKEYGRAEQLFFQSIKSDPENAESFIGRANALMHIEGREEESISMFDAAEKIDQDNPYIYSDRSRVFRFLKDYGRAEDDISRAIALYPSEWNYLDRARIRISDLNNREGAKEDLSEIIVKNDSNFFANVYLAGIYDDERDYESALKYYEKVLSIAEDYHYVYPALGKLYYIKGQWDKAADMYSMASSSRLNEMTYPLMAYLCYSQAGENKKAGSILNGNIGNLDRSSSIYEMYRYYLNSGSPYFVQLAIDKEKNELIRDRMKFYLAMIDKLDGREATASVIFNEIAMRKGAYEFELASLELEK